MSGGAVNLKAAATHMGVSESTLRRRISGGSSKVIELAEGIRAIRVCGQWRIPVDDLEAVLRTTTHSVPVHEATDRGPRER